MPNPIDDRHLERTLTLLLAQGDHAGGSWGALSVRELSHGLERRLAASREGFFALTKLLTGGQAADAYDALAQAALAFARADAAWLLAERAGQWSVIGRSTGTPVEGLAPDAVIRQVPLMSDGQLVGALAFWYADPAAQPEEGVALEAAFEAALAAAMRTRSELEDSAHDALTGLLNRRSLDDSLGRMVAFARRASQPLSLLMMDLDHFKQINDRHGHEAGDEVLKAFGQAVIGSLRASDMAIRYGGEEFVVVLPDTAAEAALGVAEKLRVATAALAVGVKNGEALRPTVSVGLATLRPDDTPGTLIDRADRALYRAKEAGRNRTVSDRALSTE